MANIETASDSGFCIARQFLNIPIAKHEVRASFWMNKDPDLIGTSLYFGVPKGGKMTPSEISEASLKTLDDQNIDPSKITNDQLRAFNRNNAIGVDCSGFTYQVTRYIFESLGGDNYDKKVFGKDGSVGITKVNSNLLSSPVNSVKVENVSDLLPGDIIRCMGGIHTLVVISKLTKSHFLCAHSTDGVPAVGVSLFDIFITNTETHVFDQYWTERNTSGIHFNWRLIDKFKQGDGIRRLKIMNDLYENI